jgi:hypothetical protein
VDDLDAFVKETAAAEPEGTPFFIGGQSMGGLIAVHEVQFVVTTVIRCRDKDVLAIALAWFACSLLGSSTYLARRSTRLGNHHID